MGGRIDVLRVARGPVVTDATLDAATAESGVIGPRPAVAHGGSGPVGAGSVGAETAGLVRPRVPATRVGDAAGGASGQSSRTGSGGPAPAVGPAGVVRDPAAVTGPAGVLRDPVAVTGPTGGVGAVLGIELVGVLFHAAHVLTLLVDHGAVLLGL